MIYSKGMKSYANLKKRILKDREVRKAYKALEPEFALAGMIIERRIARMTKHHSRSVKRVA